MSYLLYRVRLGIDLRPSLGSPWPVGLYGNLQLGYITITLHYNYNYSISSSRHLSHSCGVGHPCQPSPCVSILSCFHRYSCCFHILLDDITPTLLRSSSWSLPCHFHCLYPFADVAIFSSLNVTKPL